MIPSHPFIPRTLASGPVKARRESTPFEHSPIRRLEYFSCNANRGDGEQEEKVAFVHVEHRAADDYSVRFTDRQTVQLLRRKLLKAASILQASTDIGCMIKARFEKSNLFTADLLNVLITELDDYIAEATYYRRCVDDLLQRSWDTNNLLTNILEYRVGSSTLETSKTSDSALQKMKEIAVQGEWDNELNQKTSITTKALTVVATIYLPASLLSGLFCSNLVQIDANNHLVAVQDFWKFVVILMPMMAGTFAFVAALQKYWTGSYKREKREAEERGAAHTQ
ncbi:uncharacterized protein PV07_09040 [Cladophialophora immunda]|uniref:Uncharacterized protein n=1 Tax=Cladophialophora immunda TaxID=569365 RepID=A0A0D2CQN7_9EURO|nr:uncharacterized protein PV07_09040 [Cladophialophora immunda]KIW25904.1 hypothetical protein PV07_09040 [Cladophialophora immunda]